MVLLNASASVGASSANGSIAIISTSFRPPSRFRKPAFQFSEPLTVRPVFQPEEEVPLLGFRISSVNERIAGNIAELVIVNLRQLPCWGHQHYQSCQRVKTSKQMPLVKDAVDDTGDTSKICDVQLNQRKDLSCNPVPWSEFFDQDGCADAQWQGDQRAHGAHPQGSHQCRPHSCVFGFWFRSTSQQCPAESRNSCTQYGTEKENKNRNRGRQSICT